MTRIGLLAFCHLLRRSLRDHSAASKTTLRPDIDRIICRFYHIQIVFYLHDRIAALRQPVKDFYKLVYVCKMQPRRRLIQKYIWSFPYSALYSSAASLMRCASTPGQLRGRLPQLHIGKSHII